MKIKVGFGFDVHQLVEGRELWLGGILLEHEKGLLGHSDADVLVHAICDALLADSGSFVYVNNAIRSRQQYIAAKDFTDSIVFQ